MKIGKPMSIKRITMSPMYAAIDGLRAGKALPVTCASKAERQHITQQYYYHKNARTGRFNGVTMRQSGLTLYFMKEDK